MCKPFISSQLRLEFIFQTNRERIQIVRKSDFFSVGQAADCAGKRRKCHRIKRLRVLWACKENRHLAWVVDFLWVATERHERYETAGGEEDGRRKREDGGEGPSHLRFWQPVPIGFLGVNLGIILKKHLLKCNFCGNSRETKNSTETKLSEAMSGRAAPGQDERFYPY